MKSEKNTNYFYIDESGNINNDSNIFLHGCIKTDTPSTIRDALIHLKAQISNEIYYQPFKKQILEKGFHATENSMDMRAELYKLLPLMNYRAYFVITNKNSCFFKRIMKNMDEADFFEYSLNKLLKDRLTANENDKNIFHFESIQLKKKSLQNILDDFFHTFEKTHDFEYYIVGKKEENLAIVDYLNYIFYHLLASEEPLMRMKQNLEIISPKIAVVHLLHKNIFLSRKKGEKFKVNLKNIIENY